mmetsp:Transcript_31432/g.44608  ORF Transcript_31432/g.44608 Transcript_31432/m.44608 type:complete len:91 (+) Transcript_31432:762-1034(+)
MTMMLVSALLLWQELRLRNCWDDRVISILMMLFFYPTVIWWCAVGVGPPTPIKDRRKEPLATGNDFEVSLRHKRLLRRVQRNGNKIDRNR